LPPRSRTNVAASFHDVEAAALAVLGELITHPLVYPREPEVVAALRGSMTLPICPLNP